MAIFSRFTVFGYFYNKHIHALDFAYYFLCQAVQKNPSQGSEGVSALQCGNPAKVYIKKVYDILSKHRTMLTTNNPDNHLFLLDDFLGSGRISSIESKPIELLHAGETKTIDRVRVSVNQSVDKYKNQLKYIYHQLW